jgi:hypothetical protein
MTAKPQPEPAAMREPAGRPLALDDACFLASAVTALPRELSDSAFVNLFLFRHVHGYRIYDSPLPHIRGVAYDGAELVIPLFQLADVPMHILADILGEARWLYPFCQEEAERLGAAFDVSWSDADSDYVYSSETLRSFRGMKKRRQQLLHFEKNFGGHTTLRPLADDDSILAARKILDIWQQESQTAWAETDYSACAEALTHRTRLGLFGLLVEIDAQPAGFMLASALSTRMAAVHFAKGLHPFPGVYQFMFRAFARAHANFDLLNFEQDLGKPRFQQAKQSYRPIYLARKYRLRPKP